MFDDQSYKAFRFKQILVKLWVTIGREGEQVQTGVSIFQDPFKKENSYHSLNWIKDQQIFISQQKTLNHNESLGSKGLWQYFIFFFFVVAHFHLNIYSNEEEPAISGTYVKRIDQNKFFLGLHSVTRCLTRAWVQVQEWSCSHWKKKKSDLLTNFASASLIFRDGSIFLKLWGVWRHRQKKQVD